MANILTSEELPRSFQLIVRPKTICPESTCKAVQGPRPHTFAEGHLYCRWSERAAPRLTILPFQQPRCPRTIQASESGPPPPPPPPVSRLRPPLSSAFPWHPAPCPPEPFQHCPRPAPSPCLRWPSCSLGRQTPRRSAPWAAAPPHWRGRGVGRQQCPLSRTAGPRGPAATGPPRGRGRGRGRPGAARRGCPGPHSGWHAMICGAGRRAWRRSGRCSVAVLGADIAIEPPPSLSEPTQPGTGEGPRNSVRSSLSAAIKGPRHRISDPPHHAADDAADQ